MKKIILLILILILLSACAPQRLALSTPTLDTHPAFDATQNAGLCNNSGFQPAMWVEYTSGKVQENVVCHGGDGGSYIGACPCREDYFINAAGQQFQVAVVNGTPQLPGAVTVQPNTATLTPKPQTATSTAISTVKSTFTATKTPTLRPTATATPIATITKTATNAPTLTPEAKCIVSRWKYLLNGRPEPSMKNVPLAFLRITLDEVVPIEAVIENDEGKFAQVNWGIYAAMYLKSNGRTYAEPIACPP